MWHKLSADNMDPDFVERRRVGLETFLLRVASHPVMSNDKIFFHFLTQVQYSVCICECESAERVLFSIKYYDFII